MVDTSIYAPVFQYPVVLITISSIPNNQKRVIQICLAALLVAIHSISIIAEIIVRSINWNAVFTKFTRPIRRNVFVHVPTCEPPCTFRNSLWAKHHSYMIGYLTGPTLNIASSRSSSFPGSMFTYPVQEVTFLQNLDTQYHPCTVCG